MTDSIPSGHKPLTYDALPDYLSFRLTPSCEPEGLPEEWKVSEVGDGNLNMVFIIKGTYRIITAKQALPWLRAGGEERPLSLSRIGFGYSVLYQKAKYAGHTLIPQVCFYDPEMTLLAMEYLTPHVILRKKLVNDEKFFKLAEDIGRFSAQTLFNTSDIDMSAEQEKALIAGFVLNHELCKITEDLILTKPYYSVERNNRTPSGLNDAVHKAWADVEMIQTTIRYKYKFTIRAQALLHSNLCSGSIMVTDTDIKVIGPEFGLMEPIALDIGNHIGNLLLTYFLHPGWDVNKQHRIGYQEWLLQRIVQTWSVFTRESHQFQDNKTQGDAWPTEMYQQNRAALEDAQN